MQATVTIDDSLMNQAKKLTGLVEDNALLCAGLQALIERESARKLAALGGSEPHLEMVRRRQISTS